MCRFVNRKTEIYTPPAMPNDEPVTPEIIVTPLGVSRFGTCCNRENVGGGGGQCPQIIRAWQLGNDPTPLGGQPDSVHLAYHAPVGGGQCPRIMACLTAGQLSNTPGWSARFVTFPDGANVGGGALDAPLSSDFWVVGLIGRVPKQVRCSFLVSAQETNQRKRLGGGADRKVFRSCGYTPAYAPNLEPPSPQTPSRPPSKDWLWSISKSVPISSQEGF